MNKYMDIIDYNYTGSKSRKHMSIYERSAQFAPFAALTGFEGAIKETGRVVDSKIELSDDEKIDINKVVESSINKDILVTYFVPDKYKNGGSYINFSGRVRRIDSVYKKIIFYDKNVIDINDIIFAKNINDN